MEGRTSERTDADPLLGKRLKLDDATTGVVTHVQGETVGIALDGSYTVVFIPREAATQPAMKKIAENVHAAIRRRNLAEAKFAYLERRDRRAPIACRPQLRRGPSRERRPREARRGNPRRARAPGRLGDDEPSPPDVAAAPRGGVA